MRVYQTTEHARTKAPLKKQEQMREGAKVLAEYGAARQAIRETARLRILRLRAMLLAVIIAAEPQDEERD
jgi:hypothetical protein